MFQGRGEKQTLNMLLKNNGQSQEEGREVSIFQLRADSEGQEMTTRGVI